MKKLTSLLLCVLLLCALVRAEGGERGPTKFIALTIDDGPNGALTAQLLDGLKARYVSATFFLCGYRVEQYPELVRRMAEEGHELAIHGQSHAYLHTLPQEQIRAELQTTGDLVEAVTGGRPTLLRPPGGLTSEALFREARGEGLPIVLWSVDPEDWSTHDAGAVLRRALRKAGDGDIILMHDLSRSSVQAALALVDRLEAQGYQFCTVSELAKLRGVELVPGEKYHMFPEDDGA